MFSVHETRGSGKESVEFIGSIGPGAFPSDVHF